MFTEFKFSQFQISQEHLVNVCKKDSLDKAQTCRFLSEEGKCNKFSDFVFEINRRVTSAQEQKIGDNCNSLLSKIVLEKIRFIGKKFIYTQVILQQTIKGTIKDLFLSENGKVLYIEVIVQSGEPYVDRHATENLHIEIHQDHLSLKMSGSGIYGGETKIFLE